MHWADFASMLKRAVSRLMTSSLKNNFRRICWVGPPPEFQKDRPIVAYANHHSFYDGYVLWLLARKLLHREAIIWMAEWDRFPFFGAAGAYPFPVSDRSRRLKTIRQTAARMERDHRSFLIYFPEGTLHAPEEGILPFEQDNMARLSRILPPSYWWPISIHMTAWGEPQPTLLLTGGQPREQINGNEKRQLKQGLSFLQSAKHPCSKILLEGKQRGDEAWDMRFMRRWFERYL